MLVPVFLLIGVWGGPGRVYAAVDGMVRRAQQAGELQPGDPDRLRLLLFATMQGIAALVTTGAVGSGQIDGLITDAVALFTNSWR